MVLEISWKYLSFRDGKFGERTKYGVRIVFAVYFESLGGAGLQVKRICFQVAWV